MFHCCVSVDDSGAIEVWTCEDLAVHDDGAGPPPVPSTLQWVLKSGYRPVRLPDSQDGSCWHRLLSEWSSNGSYRSGFYHYYLITSLSLSH